MIDKCGQFFQVDDERVFLGHCSVSPLYRGAAEAIKGFADSLAAGGITSLSPYFEVVPKFRRGAAKLLQTEAQHISLVANTAEAMCMLANGYPFAPGDEIISYVHEYPSNHYPWVLQRERGVKLILLADQGTEEGTGPRGWSMDELAAKVTERTRMIAVSHVQFASGYAADLQALGAFCRRRDIDLVVDCAQSLGCLPVYPERYHIAALAASGWKWLLGPLGSGLLYTSERLRAKLRPTMAGPGLMRQGLEYLNHRWDPHTDGRMFEYSTRAWDHAAALHVVISEIFLRNSMEDVRNEIFRLQDVLLAHLDRTLCRPLCHPPSHRSGIVTLAVDGNPQAIMAALQHKGVVITGPTGQLRLAPHFYQTDAQMVRAAQLLNEVCGENG